MNTLKNFVLPFLLLQSLPLVTNVAHADHIKPVIEFRVKNAAFVKVDWQTICKPKVEFDGHKSRFALQVWIAVPALYPIVGVNGINAKVIENTRKAGSPFFKNSEVKQVIYLKTDKPQTHIGIIKYAGIKNPGVEIVELRITIPAKLTSKTEPPFF